LIILTAFDMNLFYLICLWIIFIVEYCIAAIAMQSWIPSLLRTLLFFSEYFILFLEPVKWILSDHWGFCLLHPVSLRQTRLEGLRWPHIWLWLLMSWTFILSILTSQKSSTWKPCTHLHCRVKFTILATLVSWLQKK